MARSANQKIKILYLMQILLERTDDNHGMTLEEISNALAECGVEAERKTLYDDLEVLRVFGLDIEKRKGKTVRYHVVSREFELPELKLLVDAVQSSKFITHKKSNELIKKIEGFTSRHEAQQLQRQVFVSNRIKTMNESIYYTVDYIHDAINSNVKVSFQYFSWNVKKEKVLRHNGDRFLVSPWALTWDDENYYMIGYDHISGMVKHYRVDKMLNICLTEEKRDGAELFRNFDMALYSKATFGMYGGKEQAVSLRCSNRIAGVIIDRFGTNLPFTNVTDTHFDIRIKVHTSPLFYSWLVAFGADITILAPGDVIEEYKSLAHAGLDQYQ
ncbi:MAG: WYL domain-containing protein [Oscillospiraceae bacterium]|nr:WYL domain-containing protein [Oscillospiraceae bacterium]